MQDGGSDDGDPGAGPMGGGDDGADDGGSDEDAAADPETPWQTSRYLRVTNGTAEKLTVYVQVKSQDENDEWAWYPSEPGNDDMLVYELEPGQVLELTDGDWQVNGSRARIWAESKARQYTAYRDQDLWLVPETNDEGVHGYFADDMQTADVVIR